MSTLWQEVLIPSRTKTFTTPTRLIMRRVVGIISVRQSLFWLILYHDTVPLLQTPAAINLDRFGYLSVSKMVIAAF